MDGAPGHSPRVSVKGQIWDSRAQAKPRVSRRLWLAIAGAGLLMVGGANPSQAQSSEACTVPESGEVAIIDAACCPDELLTSYWPGRSTELNQTFCQLLMFPTASLGNGDDFTDRIVDGSLSSDSRRASPTSMTLPSLWWNRDSLTSHLGGRRLVESWISYQIEDSGTTVVDVMVNPQMWSVLTYNERYAVLNQFGTAARDFGHNLRFFQGNSRTSRMAGLYACDFVDQPGLPLDSENNVYACSANLDSALIVQLQRNLVAEGERRYQPAPTAQAIEPSESP
ncbi:hypothetical protein H6F75_09435 [Nodosilinea sp. FACHB-131]|uniref:hypothetical protein n=1 Tax=Cyanophyceae TaxID=3028117 RepID=UPI0016844953|nr:hypothetical protein [Nodosilinea sp. FACHB-131]MBD1873705.1 hypothetical protein [Nodosilinea sp. FACHB-131]